MDGHEGGQDSQSSQHHHQPCYNNANSYHQGFGDYQYLPGQHWLTGSSILNHPTPDHSYNTISGLGVGGYGGNLAHYGYNNNQNGSTIHHTGQAQQQHQLNSASQPSQSQEQTSQSQQSMSYPTTTTHYGTESCGSKSSYVQQQQSLPYIHSYCSNKYHHHGQGSALPGFSNSCQPIQSQPTTTPMGNSVASNSILPPRMPWTTSSETTGYPGGLEIVWREVPEECQRLISMQDVPESAKFRGYFTVCELINLKRSLVGRLSSMEPPIPPAPLVIISDNEDSVGVGGVVKTALNTLEDSQTRQASSSEDIGAEKRCGPRNPNPNTEKDSNTPTPDKDSNTLEKDCNALEKDSTTLEKDVKEEQGEESPSEISFEKAISPQSTSPGPSDVTVITSGMPTPSTTYPSYDSMASVTAMVTTTGTVSATAAAIEHRHSRSPYASPYAAPPPAYRTASLVFKLLQIGNYQIRSFSEMNPNRLRVLFNTQRITYECHLTLVKSPRDCPLGNVRKILTIDIGFDQISMIRFGFNKLFLKVEGSPLLSVSYCPAEYDNTCPPLSQEDYILLEQIEKGQLKLSPCHQIYFINERLVHLLEAQFHQHPRFRHIIQHTCESTL